MTDELSSITQTQLIQTYHRKQVTMATMEDRLMGEKLHYYCSSSEGEDEEDEEGRVDDDNFDVEKSKQAQADKIAEKAYLGVSGKLRFLVTFLYGARTKF